MYRNKKEKRMRRCWLPLGMTCLMWLMCMGARAQREFLVMEWNVENLFDTRHDEGCNDQDFTPDGSYHWTRTRYWRKLDEIGKTIIDASDTLGLPAIIGLCEVENDSVMTDLTQRSVLRTAGYRYVMTDSPDHRGIDVALLYHPELFRLHDHHSIRIPATQQGLSPTRDILYATGTTLEADTLHIIVCHFPSKTGGVKNSGSLRKLATSTLRSVIDSVFALSPNARLLVMGDFNATPREALFKRLVPPLCETLPTSRKELNKPIGTYYFQNLWSYLDHILVSPALETGGGAYEIRLPHLLEHDGRPKRTFKGPSYNGGVSDHLPLCLKVKSGK